MVKIEDLIITAKANARMIDCGELWWTGSDVCRVLGFRTNQNGGFAELQNVRPHQRTPLPASIGGRRRPTMINEDGIRVLAEIAMKKESKHAA